MVVSNKTKAVIVWVLALAVIVAVAAVVLVVLRADRNTQAPDDVTSLQKQLNEAIDQSMNGQCQEAVIAFESLIKNTANQPAIDAEAKLRAGECYMQLRRYQDAATKFEAAAQQYATVGDTIKQGQAKKLQTQAAAQVLNNVQTEKTNTGPTPSPPAEW